MAEEYYCETCDRYHTEDDSKENCELDYTDFVDDDSDDDDEDEE